MTLLCLAGGFLSLAGVDAWISRTMACLRSTPPLDQRNKMKEWPICWCCDGNYSTVYIIKADQCSMKLKLHTQSEHWFVAVMVDVTFSCFIMHTFSLFWYLVAHATCYLPNYCHSEIWCFYTNRKNKGDYDSSVCRSKKIKKWGPRPVSYKLHTLSDIQPIIVCWDEIRWDCTSRKNMQPNSAHVLYLLLVSGFLSVTRSRIYLYTYNYSQYWG